MREAVLAREKAEAAERERLDQVSSLKAQKDGIAEDVRKQAETARDALLAEARKGLERDRAAAQARLDDETRRYGAKLQRAGGAALLSLTRKALSDLADETLEDRIARHLGQRLENLAPDLRTAAGRAEEATITSHDDLPQSGRDDLTAKLKAVFPDVSVRFETDPDQSPGLVLRIGGAELDWTVGGYVDSLSDVLTAQLAVAAEPRAVRP
jgi:F-type H+-transporting ATPase subunit b